MGALMFALIASFVAYDTTKGDGGLPALGWAFAAGAALLFALGVWAAWLRPGPRPWSAGPSAVLGSLLYGALLFLALCGIALATVVLLR